MTLEVPPDTRHRTKQEFVYATLRNAIMTCELPPGERLIIDDLARRLKVSTIPVREAIQLLQSEGLVDTIPHVGASVAAISRNSVVEVFLVLEGLEVVATRKAAQRARIQDLDALGEVVLLMDQAIAAGLDDQWADLNTHFHHGIGRLCAMPMLKEMLERTFDHWNRLRRYYFRPMPARRVEEAQREHHELVAAMRARDLVRLEAMTRQHNRGALQAYTSALDAAAGGAAPARP